MVFKSARWLRCRLKFAAVSIGGALSYWKTMKSSSRVRALFWQWTRKASGLRRLEDALSLPRPSSGGLETDKSSRHYTIGVVTSWPLRFVFIFYSVTRRETTRDSTGESRPFSPIPPLLLSPPHTHTVLLRRTTCWWRKASPYTTGDDDDDHHTT